MMTFSTIKSGWVNRNRILVVGAPFWITLPVLRGPHQQPINKRYYRLDSGSVGKVLRLIEAAYIRAPYFERVFPIVQEIMACEDSNVAIFNINLIRRLALHLGILTRVVVSSCLRRGS